MPVVVAEGGAEGVPVCFVAGGKDEPVVVTGGAVDTLGCVDGLAESSRLSSNSTVLQSPLPRRAIFSNVKGCHRRSGLSPPDRNGYERGPTRTMIRTSRSAWKMVMPSIW